jgi:transcriptional regulator with XRE-family HTH domain
MDTNLPVGELLSLRRRARRISQLDLAGEANVSARHLSFVETGRARPSRSLILRLCEALGVPPRETDTVLLAAGFAPAHRETPLEAPAMAEVLSALRLLLTRHEPLPAVAFDARWDVVMANAGYATLLNGLLAAGADPVAGPRPIQPGVLLPAPRPNMLRYLTHPKGARTVLADWPAVARAILQRVQAEARHGTPDPALAGLLADALAQPGVAALLRQEARGPAPLVVPVEIRGGPRFLTSIATLGTAQDLTLRELRIETFFPASPPGG